MMMPVLISFIFHLFSIYLFSIIISIFYCIYINICIINVNYMLYLSTAITLSDRAYVIYRHADVVISASERDFKSGYMALYK